MSKPFRSDKRKKELLRLKKQEEKRQRRFGAKQEGDGDAEAEGTDVEGAESEGGQPEGIAPEEGSGELEKTTEKEQEKEK